MYAVFLRALAALFVLSALSPSAASAADEAPPLTGVVVDAAGSPLPGATVRVTPPGRSTVTGADGRFVFRALRPGMLHVEATLLGYAPAHAEVDLPAEGVSPEVRLVLHPSALALEGLQVTATPGGADPLRVARSTVQLSGRELARNVSTSVAQTLASQPGISSRYAGPGASMPVIRGLTGERVLVLQDGQRTGDLASTSSDHGLSVDPLEASEIEVVRGPASLLYGTAALGGVVNVISHQIPTTVPSHVDGWAATQAESGSPGGAVSGAVTAPIGDEWAVALRGGLRDVDDVRVGGDGVLDNTSFRNRQAGAALARVGESVSAGAAYRFYDFEYGVPAPAGAEEAGVRLDGFRHEASGRADLVLSGAVPLLRLDGTAQWYEHDEIEADGEVATTFRLRTQTATATARTELGRLEGAVGASLLLRGYEPEGEEALTPSADSRGTGVFVFQEMPLDASVAEERAVRLQAGARYDRFDIESQDSDDFGPGRTSEFSAFSGSVGVNVPFGSYLSLSASAARAFRAPTVEELFSDGFHAAAGTFDVGDPDLREETNTGLDAVLRFQSERVTGQLSAYWSRIDDYITPAPDGTVTIDEDGESFTVPLVRFVQADAELRGLEGQVEAAVGGHWIVGATGDLVRGDFVEETALVEEGPLPYMPPARLGGSVRWDDSRWSAGAEVRRAFAQDRVTDGELATDAYTLVNLSAGTTLIRGGLVHSVTLRADNVLDELYRDAASRIKEFAPSPGRSLSLVYRVLF